MSNDQKTPESRDHRTGYGQTAYKRRLAYEHLGIDPASVPCIPLFCASLKRIARSLNHPRIKREAQVRPIRPFDCLEATDHPDACKVSRVYRSVPESYRRLLPPEAFCIAAGVDPFRVLELIAAGAARQTGQASAIIAALWHPQVVAKTCPTFQYQAYAWQIHFPPSMRRFYPRDHKLYRLLQATRPSSPPPATGPAVS